MVDLVRMDGIEKRFPGVHALKNARFNLRAGEVHALMGENGAGKSTLMKILSGVYKRDSGTILVDGDAVEFDGPRAAQDAGVGIIHQELSLMNDLTAAQNIFIGREPRLSFGRLDETALNRQAAEIFSQMNDAGIPIFAFDSGVVSDIPVTTATTDNVAAAALAADKMAEFIGGEGQVAVIAHDQTSSTGINRRDGFVDRIAEAYPDIEVVTIQYGAGDQLQSTEIAKSILTANPDLKGIFGTNEGSAIGVVNGVRESGAKDIVIIGFDSGAAPKEAIRSGLMAGAITQNPVGIGFETVKAAVQAINGETVPEVIDTGFYYYEASNIDDPEIAAVLYD